MSEKQIKSIHGLEPMREGEYPISFMVGHGGVTRIDEMSYSPEPYCSVVYYQIWKGDELHASVKDRAIGEVYYQ